MNIIRRFLKKIVEYSKKIDFLSFCFLISILLSKKNAYKSKKGFKCMECTLYIKIFKTLLK